MYPTIEGYPSIWILWGLAIVGGMVGSVAMARRDGFPFGVSLGLILLIAFTFLLGAKIHWWIMHSEALAGSDLAGALVRGFHFPGGLVLTALIVPIVFRLCGVSPLRFFDAIAPVAGLAIAVARLGCFLSGCCFGRVCSLPWGLRFPPGSRAYQYHLITYQLPKDQLATLPLHPTQLYFMLAGLGMAGVLFWMRTRKRFDRLRKRIGLDAGRPDLRSQTASRFRSTPSGTPRPPCLATAGL